MAWTYDKLKVGDKDSITKKITGDVINAFADVSNDTNPVHLDEAFAKTTQFGKRIAHGMIAAGLISAVFGSKFPGPGTIYLSQTLKFKRPVFIDDTLTAWVEITEKNDEKKRLIARTWVENQNGEPVVDGEGQVLFPL